MAKPATEYVYLSGKASWARTNTPDEWGNWKITLHPDAKSLEIVRDLQADGMKNQLKKDDDGYYVTFKRPTSKEFKGQIKPFNPPVVTKADGETPFIDGLIGNGSDVTITLEVYEHKTPGGGKAKAGRLAAVRVDALVPYMGSRDMETDQHRQMQQLASQPKPEF